MLRKRFRIALYFSVGIALLLACGYTLQIKLNAANRVVRNRAAAELAACHRLQLKQDRRRAVSNVSIEDENIQRLSVGDSIPNIIVFDSAGRPFDLHSLKGSHSVLIRGCLT